MAQDIDWSAENARGRAHADEIISRMRADDNPTLLGRVCQSFIEKGQYEGFEVGFFQRVADAVV